MREKVQLLTIVGGLVLYVFDFVSDCFVCFQHGLNGDFWWFLITLIFIVLPSVPVNYNAASQMKDKLDNGLSDKCNKMKYIAIYLANCGVIFRYIQELRQWKKVNFNKTPCGRGNQCCHCEKCRTWYSSEKEKSLESACSMAKLRYLETITESAPQWCLQTYIMLRQWYFPWYTVVSVVLSLLSLAWSITTLEKARELKSGYNFNLISTVSFLIWQLASLICRLSAMVIFAYVHRYYVFIFFVINYLLNLLFVAVVMRERLMQLNRQRDPPLGFWKCCYIIIIFSYFVMFHFTKTYLDFLFPLLMAVRYVALGNIFLALGNIIILTLSVTAGNPDVPYMGILKPVAISLVLGALLISCIFCLVYYKCCYPEIKHVVVVVEDESRRTERSEIFEQFPSSRTTVTTISNSSGFV